MDVPVTLAGDLQQLTAALDGAPHRRSDLSRSLQSLSRGAGLAVGTYLGLTVTLTVEGHDVTLTSMTDLVEPSDVSSSLRVPLALVEPGLVGQVVFYAATPDAFSTLAASLRETFPEGDGEIELGTPAPGSLSSQALVSGIGGAQELSTVNRAVGVLLGRGHSLEDARSILSERAEREGVSVHVVAGRLLDDLARADPDPA